MPGSTRHPPWRANRWIADQVRNDRPLRRRTAGLAGCRHGADANFALTVRAENLFAKLRRSGGAHAAAAIKLREAVSTADLIIIEGYEGPQPS